MRDAILNEFNSHKKTIKDTIENLIPDVEKASIIVVNTLKNGGKILLCVNGGSAADAQHIAAELTKMMERLHFPVPR